MLLKNGIFLPLRFICHRFKYSTIPSTSVIAHAYLLFVNLCFLLWISLKYCPRNCNHSQSIDLHAFETRMTRTSMNINTYHWKQKKRLYLYNNKKREEGRGWGCKNRELHSNFKTIYLNMIVCIHVSYLYMLRIYIRHSSIYKYCLRLRRKYNIKT